MVRYLKDFALYTPRPLSEDGEYFEKRSNSTLILIVSFLKRKLPNLKFKKINLMINAGFNNKIDITNDGILYCYKEIDLGSLSKKDLESQKNQILDLGFSVLQEIFKRNDIDFSILEGLREYVLENNFSNSYLGPAVKKDNLSYRTQVIQEFEKSKIYIIVKKGRKELEKIHVKTIRETNPFAFNIYLTNLKFKDENIILKTYKDEHIVRMPDFILT